jgi:HTH-type transcriptional regulator/antitoxin HigA
MARTITEPEYEMLVEMLNQVIDVVGGDQSHPLVPLMDVLGDLLTRYEDDYIPELTELEAEV